MRPPPTSYFLYVQLSVFVPVLPARFITVTVIVTGSFAARSVVAVYIHAPNCTIALAPAP